MASNNLVLNTTFKYLIFLFQVLSAPFTNSDPCLLLFLAQDIPVRLLVWVESKDQLTSHATVAEPSQPYHFWSAT